MGPHWLAQHTHAKYIMGWSMVYGSELLLYVTWWSSLSGWSSHVLGNHVVEKVKIVVIVAIIQEVLPLRCQGAMTKSFLKFNIPQLDNCSCLQDQNPIQTSPFDPNQSPPLSSIR
jgi:hypothetical protein